MQFSLPLILTLQIRRSLTARDFWESAGSVRGLEAPCRGVLMPVGGMKDDLPPRRERKLGRRASCGKTS